MTLIEVVVVIALLALISSVITAVVAIVIRVADPTTSRTLDATAERSLETWLAQDAVAVPPGGFDIAPTTASGCAGAEAADNIVRMAWTEIVPSGSTTYVANYRYDAGTEAIQRVTCSASGANPLGTPDVITIAKPIPAAPTVTLPTPSGVTVSFLTASGESVVVSSLSRNPAQTLPTTTTTAPVPCSVTWVGLSDPHTVDTDGRLSADILVSFILSGACAYPLEVRYDRGVGEGIDTIELDETPDPDRTVTLKRSSTAFWAPNPATVLTIYSNGTPVPAPFVFDLALNP